MNLKKAKKKYCGRLEAFILLDGELAQVALINAGLGYVNRDYLIELAGRYQK